MEVELNAEAKDKRLNRMVAITVVIFSIFTGLCNIKDGNIVQAMQQAQSNAVDSWNEYQAAKTKLHISQTSRSQIVLLADTPHRQALSKRTVDALDASIAKYIREVPVLARQARADSAFYDGLNVHDDQFDASEAMISTAISLAAVAALVESAWLLGVGWMFGAFGMFLGLCGFAGWAFHPDILSHFLG